MRNYYATRLLLLSNSGLTFADLKHRLIIFQDESNFQVVFFSFIIFHNDHHLFLCLISDNGLHFRVLCLDYFLAAALIFANFCVKWHYYQYVLLLIGIYSIFPADH